MLFNSYEFIFFFLPVVISGYFFLIRIGVRKYARIWLVLSSLFFYSYWKLEYLPLIVFSIGVNFIFGSLISKEQQIKNKKRFLITGIVLNLGLLGYFKYYDFFAENLNFFLGTQLPLLQLELPLGISFFTFQQIAYLVDSYREETKEYDFFDYSLFVSFFPQLIAGPIVHHKEMMPQFKSKENLFIHYRNIALGLFIFSIGLYKKVIIADTLAQLADLGHANPEGIQLIDAWLTALAYVFQLYFDFSGYSDMAVGLGLFFNIKIIWNFNSPYKSSNIQEFWKRWHITLSRFLKDYIYIPMGGNRVSRLRSYWNLFFTFLVGGIWHGAGWTYMVWGLLTAIGIVVYKFWKEWNLQMNRILGIFLNFIFFMITVVFFRAHSVEDGVEIVKGMLGLNGIVLPRFLLNFVSEKEYLFQDFGSILIGQLRPELILYLIISGIIIFFGKNTKELSEKFRPNLLYGIWTAFLFIVSVMNLLNVSKFLYFNF